MNVQRILRLPAVQDATGKSRSGIYSDIGRGLFPAPIKLGRRAIGWRTEDIETWIASRECARPA
jgi:prophage regulatory protein